MVVLQSTGLFRVSGGFRGSFLEFKGLRLKEVVHRRNNRRESDTNNNDGLWAI